MRPINLSGLYLPSESLWQRLLFSSNPDASLHQFRATYVHSGASHIHSPFFSESRRNPHICHPRDFGSWRSIPNAPTLFLGQVLVHEIYL